MPSPLAGQRVWVTGASAGIGRALIARLVTTGARVAISARRAEVLEAVAREADPAGHVVVRAADMTRRDEVRAAVEDIERALGGIDLAIFNAGRDARVSIARFSADPFIDVFTLNYLGVLYGIEAVLPGMLARGRGHLAAVASLAGYRALPAAAAYGASKAALIYTMESLRFDLAPRGITVTVINPGFVRTAMTAGNRFPMPGLMEVDEAAARIVRGLERRQKEIHFPRRLSLVMKLLRTLPTPLYERLLGALMPRRAPGGSVGG